MYDPYIDKYMQAVETDAITSCKEQKLLMQFLHKKLSSPDIVIDHEIIRKSIEVPAQYFPFELMDWEKFINAFIYGVRYKDGPLVFDRFFLMLGRGAGKNGYISFNSFFMLSNNLGIKNYDIDLVATSEEQASRSFFDLYDVIQEHEKLSGKRASTSKKSTKHKQGVFFVTKELIQHRAMRSTLRYNTSNARTKDSKRPGVVIFDEIHEYDTYDNISVHRGGLGKVKDPREFLITTDGFIRGGVLDDMKQEALSVLHGDRPKSSLFPFICRLDSKEEADDPKMWQKANPSICENATLRRQLEKEYEDSKTNGKLYLGFMAKRMNCPVENTLKAVAAWEEILATNQHFPEDINGIDAIGGLDFAETRDFCSVGAYFKKDGLRYWKQHTFMQANAPKLQGIDRDLITLAIENGLLTVVHDAVISADYCVNWYLEQAKIFNFNKICMDKYRSIILKPAFEEVGFSVEIVRKGPATHAMLSPLVDELFGKRQIIFGDDCLMRWYCGNVYKDEKENGNVEYKKYEHKKRKTDGFFALLHAMNLDGELSEGFDFDPAQFETFYY